jgi:hypothetical protein
MKMQSWLLNSELGRPKAQSDASPIFILSVPRSGSTLLRTLLDSHPAIACGPETPWLAAHQPSSVGALHQFLADNSLGYCKNFRMPRQIITSAVRQFVASLMDAYATEKGKRRWAEKTPNNVMYLEFLLELFPDAKFIHLVRDGLDSAISNSIMAPYLQGVSSLFENHMLLGPDCALENNLFNAILRWNLWNRRIDESTAGKTRIRIHYENLVRDPRSTLSAVFDFIEEPFDERVMDYAKSEHEFPDWEWGSADVKYLGRITDKRIGRESEIDSVDRCLLGPMVLYGRKAAPTSLRPQYALVSSASVRDADSDRLVAYLNSFANSTGLAPLKGQQFYAYPWLWLNGLCEIDWRNKNVLFMDGAASPIPWVVAALGARVTIVENCQERLARYELLRKRMKVRIGWVTTGRRLAHNWADVLIWSALDDQSSGKEIELSELPCVLKSGGVLALTFAANRDQQPKLFEEFRQRLWLSPRFDAGSQTADCPQADSDAVITAILRKRH